MDQSKRNEPSGTPPAAALRLLVANLTSNPVLRLTPGGPALAATLATLLEWVDSVEERLARLDEKVHVVQPELPAKLRENLYGLLSTAQREGQLEPAIPDAERPGGARAGDLFALVDALKESVIDRMGGPLK